MCQHSEAMTVLVVERDELRRLRGVAEAQRDEANRRVAAIVDAVRATSELLAAEAASEQVAAEHLRGTEGDGTAAEISDAYAWGMERARCEFLKRAAMAAVAPLGCERLTRA